MRTKELIKRTAKEIIENLPFECWSVLNTDPNQLIKIKAGESGYYPINNVPSHWLKDKTMKQYANELNEQDGIKPNIVQAMEIGSMFGWGCPGADPLNNIYNK